MKRFKIEGWHRYNDEKDFEQLTIRIDTAERAIQFFKVMYERYNFYKIDIIELQGCGVRSSELDLQKCRSFFRLIQFDFYFIIIKNRYGI